HLGRGRGDRGRLREDLAGVEPDAFGEAVPGDGDGVPAAVLVGGRSGQEGGGYQREGSAGVDAVGTGRPARHVRGRHPKSGGRSGDDYVVFFAGAPWHWPPAVTRGQRFRDLRLIYEAIQ